MEEWSQLEDGHRETAVRVGWDTESATPAGSCKEGYLKRKEKQTKRKGSGLKTQSCTIRAELWYCLSEPWLIHLFKVAFTDK